LLLMNREGAGRGTNRSCLQNQQYRTDANGVNAGLGGAFDIASADGMPDTLRMEGVEDQTTEKRSLVRRAAASS
jgi:hypothetical protein